jgi:hypothetical protein
MYVSHIRPPVFRSVSLYRGIRNSRVDASVNISTVTNFGIQKISGISEFYKGSVWLHITK